MNSFSHIYGYRERTGRRRWYVGKTIHPKKRDGRHRKAEGNNPYFHNFIRKAYRNGFEFDDVLERFTLAVVPETNASDVECFYTDKLDAMYPNGFVLRAGGSGGTMSEEQKQKISAKNRAYWSCQEKRKAQSAKNRAYWSCQEKRKAQSAKCTGWKQKEEIKKQIGETQRNFSPEKRAKKSAKARDTRAISAKKEREKRRIEKMLARLDAAYQRQKAGIKPKQTGVEFVTNLIIKADRPMTESEVAKEMHKNGQSPNSAAATLMRAAGYRGDTTYLGSRGKGKLQFVQKIERIKLESGGYAFRPLPQFELRNLTNFF